MQLTPDERRKMILEREIAEFNKNREFASRILGKYGIQKGTKLKRHVRHTSSGSFQAGSGAGAPVDQAFGKPGAAVAPNAGRVGEDIVSTFVPGAAGELAPNPLMPDIAPPTTSIFNLNTNERVAKIIDDANTEKILQMISSWETMEDSTTKLELAKMLFSKIISEKYLQQVSAAETAKKQEEEEKEKEKEQKAKESANNNNGQKQST